MLTHSHGNGYLRNAHRKEDRIQNTPFEMWKKSNQKDHCYGLQNLEKLN